LLIGWIILLSRVKTNYGQSRREVKRVRYPGKEIFHARAIFESDAT
jgi:hypothetical protein